MVTAAVEQDDVDNCHTGIMMTMVTAIRGEKGEQQRRQLLNNDDDDDVTGVVSQQLQHQRTRLLQHTADRRRRMLHLVR